MPKGKIIIISGPSGSGKTTLHKMLLESFKLQGVLIKSISATTRSPRPGETPGLDYIFLTQKQFEYRRKIGYFLEWQKVFTAYYGTPVKTVKSLIREGKHVLLCIDVKGAEVVRKKFPDVVSIFIKVPNLSILKKRLMARGSENQVDLKVRLKTAQEELCESNHYDYVIINDRLNEAYRRLEALVVRIIGLA